jgi:hypothetical protein
MTKVAFQASVPGALFDDGADCLHKVVKPMLTAIRDQMREKGIPANVRISIMVDEVPAEIQPEERTNVTQAVRKAIEMGAVVDA